MKLKSISRWISPLLNEYSDADFGYNFDTLKIIWKYKFYITKLLLQSNMTVNIQISFLWYSHDMQLPQRALPNNVIYFIFKNLIILANYPYNLPFKYCLVVSKNSAYHRCWERLKAGGDGWMVSPTRWTGVWASSGSWWWTGKPGML